MDKINSYYHKKYIIDIFFILIIFSVPFLFYLYKLIPDTKVWSTTFFTIESHNFNSVKVLFYYLINKSLLICLLSAWFLTCKHWWRYVIFIPLSIEIFKFVSIIFEDSRYFDEFEYVYSLPVIIPVVLVLIYLSKKLNYFSLSKSLNSELNQELESLFREVSVAKSKKYKEGREQFEELQKQKNIINKEDYIKKLILIKNEIQFGE